MRFVIRLFGAELFAFEAGSSAPDGAYYPEAEAEEAEEESQSHWVYQGS